MGGATKDYNFKKKNDWRGWVWNQVAQKFRMARINPANAVVLGLFGKEALDVEHALKRGFRMENLFSVERDEASARQQRAVGLNVIRGTLSSVLNAWHEPQINFLYGDLCGGLNEEVELATEAMTKKLSIVDGCVALNLLRGREKDFAWRMDFWNKYCDAIGVAPDKHPMMLRLGISHKHRGYHASMEQISSLCDVAARRGGQIGLYPGDEKSIQEWMAKMMQWIAPGMKARFFTYKSGVNLYFDSVVYTWPPRVEGVDHESGATGQEVFRELMELTVGSVRDEWGWWKGSTSETTERRITAAKAVRTVRKRQEGEH